MHRIQSCRLQYIHCCLEGLNQNYWTMKKTEKCRTSSIHWDHKIHMYILESFT
ncbi:hypothetical protein GDO78_022366 [Eleutherodactylus coqui]|uniref:Uncharacterized protein n=1 Tax=Eleutherodactylus coqui TaxID=57060 RepID=A0A8J6EGG9_ELECQ|nr:hypothetical protein GDO78_022366 [Eleutherodactylus coqui]